MGGGGGFFDFIGDVISDIGGAIKDVGKAAEEVGKAFGDAVEWTYDVTESIVSTSVDWVVDSADIYTLVTHPDDYLKQMTYDTFQVFADPLGEAIGDKELANQITYYAAIVALIVAAIIIGPEVAAAMDYLAAVTLEYIASSVVLSAVASTIIYYTFTGLAIATTMLITTYGLELALSYTTEAYFQVQYGMRESIRNYQMQQAREVDFSSMLLNGSIFDWMAGGIALNAVMSGGDISYPAAPNDPYYKAFMYESPKTDIASGVKLNMTYENLAGGDMFGMNGWGSDPYNPLQISVL